MQKPVSRSDKCDILLAGSARAHQRTHERNKLLNPALEWPPINKEELGLLDHQTSPPILKMNEEEKRRAELHDNEKIACEWMIEEQNSTKCPWKGARVELEGHFNLTHILAEQDMSVRYVPCRWNKCRLKFQNSQGHLLNHIRNTHVKHRPSKCDTCGERFTPLFRLQLHESLAHPVVWQTTQMQRDEVASLPATVNDCTQPIITIDHLNLREKCQRELDRQLEIRRLSKGQRFRSEFAPKQTDGRQQLWRQRILQNSLLLPGPTGSSSASTRAGIVDVIDDDHNYGQRRAPDAGAVSGYWPTGVEQPEQIREMARRAMHVGQAVAIRGNSQRPDTRLEAQDKTSQMNALRRAAALALKCDSSSASTPPLSSISHTPLPVRPISPTTVKNHSTTSMLPREERLDVQEDVEELEEVANDAPAYDTGSIEMNEPWEAEDQPGPSGSKPAPMPSSSTSSTSSSTPADAIVVRYSTTPEADDENLGNTLGMREEDGTRSPPADEGASKPKRRREEFPIDTMDTSEVEDPNRTERRVTRSCKSAKANPPGHSSATVKRRMKRAQRVAQKNKQDSSSSRTFAESSSPSMTQHVAQDSSLPTSSSSLTLSGVLDESSQEQSSSSPSMDRFDEDDQQPSTSSSSMERTAHDDDVIYVGHKRDKLPPPKKKGRPPTKRVVKLEPEDEEPVGDMMPLFRRVNAESNDCNDDVFKRWHNDDYVKNKLRNILRNKKDFTHTARELNEGDMEALRRRLVMLGFQQPPDRGQRIIKKHFIEQEKMTTINDKYVTVGYPYITPPTYRSLGCKQEEACGPLEFFDGSVAQSAEMPEYISIQENEDDKEDILLNERRDKTKMCDFECDCDPEIGCVYKTCKCMQQSALKDGKVQITVAGPQIIVECCDSCPCKRTNCPSIVHLSDIKLHAVNLGAPMGYGMRIDEPAQRGQILLEFTGQVTSEMRGNDDEWSYTIINGKDKHWAWLTGVTNPHRSFHINPRVKGNAARFISHSAHYNVGWMCIYRGGIRAADCKAIIFTYDPLEPGDLLYLDYGIQFVLKHFPNAECLCEQELCHGEIGAWFRELTWDQAMKVLIRREGWKRNRMIIRECEALGCNGGCTGHKTN